MFTEDEIKKLTKEHETAPHERALQKALAKDVTVRVHSLEDYEMAVKASEILFSKEATEALKSINEKTAYISIIIGLIGGFLMFPFPDFSKSLLVGILIPKEMFAPFIVQSLLFLSFVVATFLPAIILKIKKL